MNSRSNDIVRQRCFNHAHREAAARCLECRRFFCRECVTEHEDRMVCSACLARLAERSSDGRSRWRTGVRAIALFAGLMVAWAFFFVLGRGLVALPSTFHDGSVWRVDPWE